MYKDLILSKVLTLQQNGFYKLNTSLCDYHSALIGIFNDEFISLFGPRRFSDEKPTENHLNLASSVQAAFEETLEHILKPVTINYPQIKNIVLTGGCALNVTANGKLIKSKTFREIVIPPAPHDAGCAIGAGICHLKEECDLSSIGNPYLGRGYTNVDISKELFLYLKHYIKEIGEDELIETTAKLLSDGKLIAWFQGRSEFGPRALGSRSFLADPRNDRIRDEINLKIKKRELFRPFAPSILEDSIDQFFDLYQLSPYMNMVANVLNDSIPAVTHIDKTARVHTVSRKSNKRYYDLIDRFGKITGIPVLLNTSFNIQEPIVYSPKDAIKTFINSGVDALVIGDYIIRREDISHSKCL